MIKLTAVESKEFDPNDCVYSELHINPKYIKRIFKDCGGNFIDVEHSMGHYVKETIDEILEKINDLRSDSELQQRHDALPLVEAIGKTYPKDSSGR